MQNALARRLKAVMDTRYEGVARKASLAAGLNENAVLRILENPYHKSKLETLDKMARAYGWNLCDVVMWALGREEAAQPSDPVAAIAQILAAAGYEESDREYITRLAQRFAPERVSKTVPSE
jgi:hypothetical protein